MVSIDVSSPAIVNQPLKINVSAIDTSGILGYTLTWTSASNPYAQTLRVDEWGVATLTPTLNETYIFTITARNGSGVISSPATKNVSVSANSGAPVVAITAPSNFSTINSVLDVIGSVSDTDLTSWALKVYDESGTLLKVLATGTTTKAAGSTLGTIDATVLPSDDLILELTAIDATGKTARATRNFSATSMLKLGNFNIAFTDLTIPNGSLPITITRVYDSFKASQNTGDFGPGWSLQWSTVSSEVNDASVGGLGNGSYPAFINGSRVNITLPDGRIEGFTFQARQVGGSSYTGLIYQPSFIPDGGNTSYLGVTQMKLSDPFNNGTEYWTERGTTYNPQDPLTNSEFILMTADGQHFAIDPSTGEMKGLLDVAGNLLTMNEQGISSTSGVGVTFTRDRLGNITRITDRRGNAVTYEYDYTGNKGRLKAFRDRVQTINHEANPTDPNSDKKTTYEYLDLLGYENYLDKVKDPAGQVAVDANYDLTGGSSTVTPTGTGRLSSMTDASTATTNMTYTLNAGTQDFRQRVYAPGQLPSNPSDKYTEIKLDQNGRPTQNVASTGVITNIEYAVGSALPKPIKQTVIVGTADTPTQIANGTADDLVTNIVYDTNGLIKEQTDPLGNKTLYQYDLSGQITSTSDPQGNGAFFSYSTVGQIDLVTGIPQRSNVRSTGDGFTYSQFSYDASGNVQNIVNPGRRPTIPVGATYSEYYRISQRIEHGELDGPITSLGYDSQSRLISTTDPDGITRSVTRDSNGNATGTSFNWVDPNNASISKVIATSTPLNPNDRPTGSSVTVNGTPQTSTQSFYDDFGRAWKTIDANGLESQTIYDRRGLVIQTKMQTRDATGSTVWNETRTTYDGSGRVVYVTDSFVSGTAVSDIYGTMTTYNGAGQVTGTTRYKNLDIQIVANVDGSFSSSVPGTSTFVYSTSTSYDANNRVIESIDGFSKKTQTYYDKFGQVVETRSETRSAANDAGATPSTDQWLVTRTVYDSNGRVIFTSDPYATTYATVLGPSAGNSSSVYGTRTFYDYQGRTYQTSRVSGAVVGWNSNNNQTVLVNEGTPVSTTSTQYDLYNHAYKQIAADGQVTITEYDDRDRVIAALSHHVPKALVGLAASYSTNTHVRLRNETKYNIYGQAYQTIDNIIEYGTVDGGGNFVKAGTDVSQQRITEQQYDEQARVTKTIYPNGTNVQSQYDVFGRVTKEIDQLSREKDFEYDLSGRLKKVSLPAVPNPVTTARPVYQYEYNSFGQMSKLTDALGHVTSFGFDAWGRQTSRTLPLTQQETTSYDDRGRVILAVSFEGVYTRTVYDDSAAGGGRVRRTEIFANATDYNNFRNGGSFNGALAAGVNWERMSYQYDAFGRMLVTKHEYNNGATTGNPTTVITTDTWTATYDALGQLSQEVTSSTGANAATGGTVGYEYDALGRKARTWAGSTTATASTALSDVTYTYDDLGRLATINTVKRDGAIVDSNGAGAGTPPETTTNHYDLLARMDYLEMPNSVVEDYTFDNMDRLDILRHYVSDSNNAVLTDNVLKDEFDYGYANDNQRTTLQEKFVLNSTNKITNYTWAYDASGRLSSEQIDHWDNNFDQTETYIYDLVSNRLQKTTDRSGTANDTTFKYTYDNNDRLTGETRHADLTGTATANQTTTYTWNGTQQASKAVVTTSVSTVTQSMVYGLTGQLAQVTRETKNSGGTVTARTRVDYRYDTSGIRFIAIDSTDSNLATTTFDSAAAGRTEYQIDHNNFTGYGQTIIETKYNTSNQATERTSYTFGMDEITQTISTLNVTTGAVVTTTTYVFDHDGHGSVRALIAASAAFAEVYTYTAYGELLAIHSALAAIISGSASSLADPSVATSKSLYNGEAIDNRTGMYNFRARWYSAANARFERLDPFAGDPNNPFSFNKYGFVHSNPVMGIDPSGEVIVFVHGINNHNGPEARQLTRTLNRMWDSGSQRRQEIIHYYHGTGENLDNLGMNVANGGTDNYANKVGGRKLGRVLDQLASRRNELGSNEPITVIAYSNGSNLAWHSANIADGNTLRLNRLIMLGGSLDQDVDFSVFARRFDRVNNFWSRADRGVTGWVDGIGGKGLPSGTTAELGFITDTEVANVYHSLSGLAAIRGMAWQDFALTSPWASEDRHTGTLTSGSLWWRSSSQILATYWLTANIMINQVWPVLDPTGDGQLSADRRLYPFDTTDDIPYVITGRVDQE